MTKWLGVRRDGDYYDDDGHLATEIEYIDEENKQLKPLFYQPDVFPI